MKHPCVELYFEMEAGPLDIRIWLKTNDILTDGRVGTSTYFNKDGLVKSIRNMKCVDKEEMVKFLEMQNTISAFQVCYRHDMHRTAVIVYREWP